MSTPDDPSPPRRSSLNVLPNSGKINELRREAQQNPSAVPTKHVDTTLVSRFVDPNKTPKQKAIEEKVVSVLRTIYDPELPVNIYDLGLIYEIDVDAETSKVHVKMTLTAPACPVAGTLPGEVERKIETLEEVPSATVELVWEPSWSRDRMSEAAQLELGLM